MVAFDLRTTNSKALGQVINSISPERSMWYRRKSTRLGNLVCESQYLTHSRCSINVYYVVGSQSASLLYTVDFAFHLVVKRTLY